MKKSGRWLLFQQLSFVPKHVTLSQKIRLALPASIPASRFFDQEAVPNKNSKGDIRGFPNWDWKISLSILNIACKNTKHHTQMIRPNPVPEWKKYRSFHSCFFLYISGGWLGMGFLNHQDSMDSTNRTKNTEMFVGFHLQEGFLLPEYGLD